MKFRILIVDDYPDAADISCLLLEHLGHQCEQASTGHGALLMAAWFDPHVIVLDIGLPDLSGYDVARMLRMRAQTRCFITAATGWGEAKDRERAAAAGFNHHMLKPTDLVKYRAMLERAQTFHAALAVSPSQ